MNSRPSEGIRVARSSSDDPVETFPSRDVTAESVSPTTTRFPTMTHDSPSDDLPFGAEITTPEAFETALHTLLLSAIENDVDPRGAWEYRTDSANMDWEVMVLELQARDASD